MTRDLLLTKLAQRIAGIERPHPIRVAIDGVDAAGKTTLADELVQPIERLGRPVTRASIDGFHNPSVIRYRRGRNSPDGYFRDSFNYAAIIESLLAPLGSDGHRRYRCRVFDYRTDRAVDTPIETAPQNAVLLFDGVFLLTDELRPFWDFSVFVKATFETTVARAEQRDAAAMGGADQVRARYAERYVPGQRLYLKECEPERRASVVVRNDVPESPMLSLEADEMGTMPSVRPVQPKDIPQWIAMRHALWPDETGQFHITETATFFAVPRQLGSLPEAVLVAEDGSGDETRLVGFAEVSRRLYAEGCRTSPVGFLEGWYVVPEERRQGIGRALVDASEAWARGMGCKEFASDALADNQVSTSAHLALGFAEVEVIRCFRKDLP